MEASEPPPRGKPAATRTRHGGARRSRAACGSGPPGAGGGGRWEGQTARQRAALLGKALGFFDGTLRFQDGRIEKGEWLVVGKEAERSFAIWDEKRKRLMHVPEQAEFLRAYLNLLYLSA